MPAAALARPEPARPAVRSARAAPARPPRPGAYAAALAWGGRSVLQRKCACGGEGPCPQCEEEEQRLQRKAEPAERAGGRAYDAVSRGVYGVLRGGGHPLDPGERAFFEPRLGHDLSGVRVHTGAAASDSARSVGALAYTVGRHVVFRGGEYRPGSPAGRGLLAHELAHVVQQRGAPEPRAGQPLSIDSDGAAEREARGVEAGTGAAKAAAKTSGGDPAEKPAAGEEAAAGPAAAPEPGLFAAPEAAGSPALETGTPAVPVDTPPPAPRVTPPAPCPDAPPYSPKSVTPTFTASRPAPKRSNTDPSTTKVNTPTFVGAVWADPAAKGWRYRIESVAGTGTIQLVFYEEDHYPAPTPTDDSGTLSNVTRANWKAIVKDLETNKNGVPDFWSAYQREVLHEDYHWVTEWQGEVKKELATAESDVAKLTVGCDKAATRDAAKAVLEPQATKIFKDAMQRARKSYDALGDSPGDPPYQAQAPALEALAKRVKDHAAANKW